MRPLVVMLAACYAPSAQPGAPCDLHDDCPRGQLCDRGACSTSLSPPDAALDAALDAPAGRWGTPSLVFPFPLDDDDPTLTDDLLTLYFNRSNTSIVRVDRPSIGAPWSVPLMQVELGPATTPEVSGDGATIYFASDRVGGEGNNDLWYATRSPGQPAWDSPVHDDALSTAGEETNAVVSADRRSVVFARRFPAGRLMEIVMAQRASVADPWPDAVSLDVLNSAQADGDAMLSRDGLAIYFYSTRAGAGDLYVATRASTSAAFGTPQPIAELNLATALDQDPWISPDGRHLFFASDRSGVMAIYESSR